MSDQLASAASPPEVSPKGPTEPPPDGCAAGGDIPVQAWDGSPLDCGSCPHAALRHSGGCEPGRSCMQDAYARRIDRFFRSHPALADEHLAHPYFEVRAIAARHADLFRLPALLGDPDETVRLQLALRVPQRLLARLRGDPHREVRIRVAQRLADADLPTMMRDADYDVRRIVARRLPEALLPLMLHDSDAQVRAEVARRVPMPALWRMVEDPAAEVRRVVAERLPAPLLQALAADLDFLVRWTVAGRALGPVLERLRQDADAEVRDQAEARLAALPGPVAGSTSTPSNPPDGEAGHGRHRP